jgi:hypothetical protein
MSICEQQVNARSTIDPEELISLTIEYIMTVNARAVDKNELVAKILSQEVKE